MSYPQIHIVEECMREGMQIESVEIPSRTRWRCSTRFRATGLRTIVVGSPS